MSGAAAGAGAGAGAGHEHTSPFSPKYPTVTPFAAHASKISSTFGNRAFAPLSTASWQKQFAAVPSASEDTLPESAVQHASVAPPPKHAPRAGVSTDEPHISAGFDGQHDVSGAAAGAGAGADVVVVAAAVVVVVVVV